MNVDGSVDASGRMMRGSLGWFHCGAVVVIALVLALQLWYVNAPFGLSEINGGSYFGPFAVTWDQHGFGTTGGMPVWSYRYQGLGAGVAYGNHPPGFAWLCGFGISEWAIRLPSIVGLTLSTAMLILLLRISGLAKWTLVVGLVSMSPCLSVASRSSYECTVLFLGLVLIYCTQSVKSKLPSNADFSIRLVAAAVSAVGVWIDWPFAFFLAAQVCWFHRGMRRFVLVWCWLPALISGCMLIAWHTWARSVMLRHGIAMPSFFEIFRATQSASADLGDVASRMLLRWKEAYGSACLLLLAIGIGFALVVRTRIALALIIVGFPYLVLFSHHASTHIMFHAYLAPVIAVAIASLFDIIGKRRHLAMVLNVGVLLLIVATTWRSVVELERSSDPLMAQIGSILDGASGDLDEKGGVKKLYFVKYNLPYSFAYYIKSPLTETGVRDLRLVRMDVAPVGIKFILFDIHVTPETSSLRGMLEPPPTLIEQLAPYPFVVHTELERDIEVPFSDDIIHIRHCREYTLR